MEDLFSLAGTRFLVTGGTRGIGRAISLCFARSGASVIAVYVRDSNAAEELAGIAYREGLRIEVCRADLTGEKGLDVIREHLDSTGSATLHGVVHGAATGIHKGLEALSARYFDWTFSLNVRAFIDLIKLVLPRLQNGSSILALSSKGATRAVPHYSLVGASKGALESLVRHFAAELAPRGIRVNALCPGSVLTDAWKVMPDSEKRLEETVRRTPLGRLVTADEVARAAQFLCSSAASGITGHTLVVDGGAAIVE